MINELTETQKAYMAAFIDADGSITIRERRSGKRSNFSAWVNIYQSDGPFMKALQEEIGGGFLYSRKRGSHLKEAFCLRFTGPDVEDLLCQVLPYMKVKYHQACLVIDFRKTFSKDYAFKSGLPWGIWSLRDKCHIEMQRLNHRESGMELYE